MSENRKQHSAESKARVVLAAAKGLDGMERSLTRRRRGSKDVADHPQMLGLQGSR